MLRSRSLLDRSEPIAHHGPTRVLPTHLLDSARDTGRGSNITDSSAVTHRAGVATGRQRLFQAMRDIGWLYEHRGRLRPRQTAIEQGCLHARAQSHRHPRTGDIMVDPPQVRVTLRGMERLGVRLGVLSP